jgi:hypothetical protein
MPPRIIDITGCVFGRWVVLRQERGYSFCLCQCGTEKRIATDSLKRGDSKSCGCARMQRSQESHGLSHLPEYHIWGGMKERCYYSRAECFENYGGRGIRVCDRWRNSFHAFYEDMGPRPSKMHSLDRIDNDGDYAPGNVRWATSATQASNRRGLRLLEFNGKKQTAAQWAPEVGLAQNAILGRIKRGWSVERSLTEPRHPTRGGRH